MGGSDKGLVTLAGKPLIEYVVEALSPQVDSIIINANRNQARYASYGCPVIADSRQGYQGPLAGMMGCMEEIDTEFMVSTPCDSPLIPGDLVSRLFRQLVDEDAEISVAHNGERMQPVFTLMKVSLTDSIRAFLDGGERKIDKWFKQHKLAVTDFSDNPMSFSNINNPAELKQMEAELNILLDSRLRGSDGG